MDWYQKNVLLFDPDHKVEGIVVRDFFKGRYAEGINGSKCFLEIEPMNFHRFKVIEIESDTKVILHMQFTHPKYLHGYQKIYLSDDLELMIERLRNQVVFLYQKEFINEREKEVRWNIYHKFAYFCTDVTDFSYFNYLFSPNL